MFPVCIDIYACVYVDCITCEPVTIGSHSPPRPMLKEHTTVSFILGLSYLCSLLFWRVDKCKHQLHSISSMGRPGQAGNLSNIT